MVPDQPERTASQDSVPAQSITEQFRAARDLLLEHRLDAEAAHAAFSWPQFEHFNFATD